MPPAVQALRPGGVRPREHILEAALHCRSQLDFDGASNRAIPRRASLERPTSAPATSTTS